MDERERERKRERERERERESACALLHKQSSSFCCFSSSLFAVNLSSPSMLFSVLTRGVRNGRLLQQGLNLLLEGGGGEKRGIIEGIRGIRNISSVAAVRRQTRGVNFLASTTLGLLSTYR